MTSKNASHRPSFSVTDRKLGDEWEHWQGDLNYDAMNSHAGKRIFMGVLLAAWFMWGATGGIILYLISPRLSQFWIYLPLITGLILAASWAVLGVWFLLMAVSLLLRRDFLVHFKGHTFSLTALVPMAFRLGSRLGISRDRLGNSFVNVSNLLIKNRLQKLKADELMIILPRCLRKTVIDRIKKVADTLKVNTFIVAGGSKARELILEHRPKGIIGVACERDLLSGIQDVVDKIPVIGIPNVRPEGPCKNTEIDWNEFVKALTAFLPNENSIRKLCTENA